jgi:capsular polysaccharide biosynthesis protein
MNRHLLRALLAFYPRPWRDRYGAELASLTEHLIGAGEITPLLAVRNLLGGAALEWGRVLAGLRRGARSWTAVGALTACGLLAGIAVAALHPPMLTSTALVVLPASASSTQSSGSAEQSTISPYTATQMVIADSNQVLAGALPFVRPAMSLGKLRSVVQVASVAPYIISVSVKERAAADAEATANAVADSYVAYVNSPSSPIGHVTAQMLAPAVHATGRPLPTDLLITGGLGALLGALIGAIDAVAFSRSGRRFRTIW